VLQVLAVASAGLILWLPRGIGPALDVAVSLLVITCPCAIGIALPLAYEVTQARLRRAGFFARTTDLLDRLDQVRTLIFDKTGTLTLGRLALVDDATVGALDAEARAAGETHWFHLARELSERAYFSSEIGMTRALRYVRIPGKWVGCTPLAPNQPAWG
jgi:P-type E1-E2 ATPase